LKALLTNVTESYTTELLSLIQLELMKEGVAIMDLQTHTTNAAQSPGAVIEPTWVDRFRHSKALIPTMAVMGVTVMALAAALVVNKSDARSGDPGPAMQAIQAAPQKGTSVPSAYLQDGDGGQPRQSAQRAPVVAQASPRPTAPRTVSCGNCGTVESAVAVQRQGKVNGVNVGNTTVGLGTVAGGVLGGVLGNQVGGGNGRTAMTVIGAAGGAYAGNRVEENMKKVTVYQMRVRMNDGSTRTIEQSAAVAVGSRVVVEGNSMRLASN
jgi:outer membrane lipoprotein SlyB